MSPRSPKAAGPKAGRTAAAKTGRQRRKPRTAEEIGRTDIGPRTLPGLMSAGRRQRTPAMADEVLDNGLRVIAVRRADTPLVEVRLRIPFGASGRTSAGVHAARAELLGSTALLGTSTLDRAELDDLLADIGGHLDAAVDPQRLLYSGSVLGAGLPALLGILGHALTEAGYRANDVAREKTRLLEHLAIARSQPGASARIALQRSRFGDHPAALELPDPEVLTNVTPAALRGLHRKAVVPDGSLLVLVGDLRPSQAVEWARTALAGWTGANRATELTTPPAVTGDKPVEFLHRPGSVQSQVRLTGPAVGRDAPEYPALQLANLIYGGYFSSRLVENIREDKGYTYSAGSGIEFWPGRAALTVSFDTTSEATAAALNEARYELGRLALVAPEEQEIASARNYAVGALAISLSTQAGLASNLASVVGAGMSPQWLLEHGNRLLQVTDNEVAEASAAYFAPANFSGIVQGDADVVTGQLRLLPDVSIAQAEW
ncbi:pitrilysin family protein [Nakamurella aerolata]